MHKQKSKYRYFIWYVIRKNNKCFYIYTIYKCITHATEDWNVTVYIYIYVYVCDPGPQNQS